VLGTTEHRIVDLDGKESLRTEAGIASAARPKRKR
jgi:hypothetical protein